MKCSQTLKYQSQPEKTLVPLEVAEFQYFMSCQKSIKMDSALPLGYPGRPIVSACGSLTGNISSYANSILKPHMEFAGHYCSLGSDVAFESRGTAIDPHIRHIFT